MSHQRYSSTVVATVLCGVVLITAACGLQPVSNIQVKASPNIYIPLGTKSFAADEFVSPSRFADMLKSDASPERKATVYYYNPPNKNPDQLRFLLHYPLQSVPLDIGEYFDKNTDAGKELNLSRDFNKTIAIPQVENASSIDIATATINDKLLQAFNKDVTPVSKTVPPVGSGYGTVSLEIPISFEGFGTVEFEDSPSYYPGSALTLSTESADISSYSIQSAVLVTHGTSINGEVTGRTIRFPFRGNQRTISNNVTLKIDVALSSSSGGTVKITKKLEGTIVRATGVTSDLEIPLNEAQVSIPLPEGFRSAKIADGAVALKVDKPAGWSGISIQYKTTIKQEGTGGLDLSPSSFTPENDSVSLAGKSLNNRPQLTYKPALKVNLTNATYTHENGQQIKATCTVSIKKFEEITLEKDKLNKDGEKFFEQTQTVSAPDSMKQWVRKIHFKKVTARVTLNNGLPENNPITIKLKSDVFHIDGSGSFPAGQEETKTYDSTISNPPGFDVPITDTTTFDLTSTVVLPGNNDTEKTFTLKNITAGEDIQLSGKVSFEPDWEFMIVQANNTQENSLNLDVSSSPIFSQLEQAGIQVNEMPMHFYAGSNSTLLDGALVDVDLFVEAQAKDGTKTTERLLPEDKGKNLKLVPLAADVFKDAKGDEGSVKTIEAEVPGPMFTVHTLHNVLNTYPSSCQFKYKVAMGGAGLEITREKYDKVKKDKNNGKITITVDLLLELPIGFTVPAGGKELELPSPIDKPVSLFGGNGALNGLPLDKDGLKIRKLQLNAKLENKSGFSPDFVLRITDTNKKPLLEDKTVALKPGNQELKLTEDDWEKLKSAGSFMPALYLKLPKGEHVLKKDLGLKVTLFVTAAADINYQVVGGSGK